MSSSAHLSQLQFLQVRSRIAAGLYGGGEVQHRIELDGEDFQKAEHLMHLGLVDVPRALNESQSDASSDLPLIHSVIEVPNVQGDLTNTYFVEDHAPGRIITVLGVRLIKSDYVRDGDFGKWLELSLNEITGWKYVYPEDAR